MGARLTDADVGRLARAGVTPLSPEQGLALFDARDGASRPRAAGATVDRRPRPRRRRGHRGRVLRGPDPSRAARTAPAPTAGGAARAWPPSSPPGAEADRLPAYATGPAAGGDGPGPRRRAQVDPRPAFTELGFDSLAAVELRNRLAPPPGCGCPATVVFDHPSVARRWPATCSDRLRQRRAPPIAVAHAHHRTPPTSRSRSSAWPAATPAGSTPPTSSGSWSTDRHATPSPDFPTDRGWDLERLYDPDPDHPGTSYTRHGGFLHDAADFDAEFFGITPREALAMDPQQRLLLETALGGAGTDAGIDPATLRGSRHRRLRRRDVRRLRRRGCARPAEALRGLPASPAAPASVASGRIAYTLGLEGPAVTVDTACSSSLVAMHLAAQALRAAASATSPWPAA